MTTASNAWNVLEHGPIEQLSENLWRVQGVIPKMSLKRVMTIAKMQDSRLVLHSPIALNESEMQRLELTGAPGFILVPSGYHRMDVPAFKTRFPLAAVLTPRGSRSKVEEVLDVDGDYESFPNDGAVRLSTLPGVSEREGVMLVESNDGVTVILNDVVMNMDRKKDVLGFLFTTLLGSAPGPRVSRLTKLVLVRDKAALRGELERLASLPRLVRLIVSHEKVAHGSEAAQALRTAATYLT
jgi:hypothetical protein